MRLAFLETRVPPPIVMVLVASVMWTVARYTSSLTFTGSMPVIIPVAMVLLGLVLNSVPKVSFGRAGTTVNPMTPHASARLVSGGLYRVSRNPMYLGHVLILLGWGVYLQNGWSLALVMLYVLYVQRFQILPEEHALRSRFPGAYDEYANRVRRWL